MKTPKGSAASLQCHPTVNHEACLAKAVSHVGVAKSLKFMKQNFHRPIMTRDLAAQAGLSRRGFFKAFRQHTGERPGQTLCTLRIEHAKNLLGKVELPLAQLASKCGYRSVNSFWVAFRREAGLSPKQFQRHVKVQPENPRPGRNLRWNKPSVVSRADFAEC